MFLTRKTMMVVLVVVVCACLVDHAQSRKKILKHTELSRALVEASKAVQKNDILFTPFRIVFRLIDFLIRAVTYPLRFVYRLVFNFAAIFGLLMLGCRVIPETRCPNRRVADVVEEIVAGIEEELQFLATMDVNAVTS